MNWIQRFLTAIATHKADASAHHAKTVIADLSPIALADLDPAVCSETEAAALIAAQNHPVIVRKTADQTVNNSDVFVNDDHLLLAIGANEVWLVVLHLLQQSLSADADFKCKWAYPVNCSILWDLDQISTTAGETYGWLSQVTSKVSRALLTETDLRALGAGNVTQGLRLTAIVVNGANAGNLNFQWAQSTATAEDTKVLTNSVLTAQKIA